MKKLFFLVLSVALAFGAVAHAGTIDVDINDGSCVTGSGQPDPYTVVYCNIQDAIDDATGGGHH